MVNVQDIGEAVGTACVWSSAGVARVSGNMSIREHVSALRMVSHPRKSKHECKLNKTLIHAGIIKISPLSLLLLVHL